MITRKRNQYQHINFIIHQQQTIMPRINLLQPDPPSVIAVMTHTPSLLVSLFTADNYYSVFDKAVDGATVRRCMCVFGIAGRSLMATGRRFVVTLVRVHSGTLSSMTLEAGL